MALQQIVEQAVTGLGLELVEITRSAGGLLRVTIDLPWNAEATLEPGQVAPVLTVEDCEKLTRQLQYALEVEAIDYRRLEVSSPGIDRPLRGDHDLQRFTGELVDITLKEPVGEAAQGLVASNRKKFRGRLERADAADGVGGAESASPQWQVVWSDPPVAKPGQRVSAKRAAAAPVQVLGFVWDEVREARLAPVVNFKGRAPVGGQGGESA